MRDHKLNPNKKYSSDSKDFNTVQKLIDECHASPIPNDPASGSPVSK
jgi:hypothetical protein